MSSDASEVSEEKDQKGKKTPFSMKEKEPVTDLSEDLENDSNKESLENKVAVQSATDLSNPNPNTTSSGDEPKAQSKDSVTSESQEETGDSSSTTMTSSNENENENESESGKEEEEEGDKNREVRVFLRHIRSARALEKSLIEMKKESDNHTEEREGESERVKTSGTSSEEDEIYVVKNRPALVEKKTNLEEEETEEEKEEGVGDVVETNKSTITPEKDVEELEELEKESEPEEEKGDSGADTAPKQMNFSVSADSETSSTETSENAENAETSSSSSGKMVSQLELVTVLRKKRADRVRSERRSRSSTDSDRPHRFVHKRASEKKTVVTTVKNLDRYEKELSERIKQLKEERAMLNLKTSQATKTGIEEKKEKKEEKMENVKKEEEMKDEVVEEVKEEKEEKEVNDIVEKQRKKEDRARVREVDQQNRDRVDAINRGPSTRTWTTKEGIQGGEREITCRNGEGCKTSF